MTHLYKVGQVYYYRVRIPSDLVQYFPCRREIRRSLRTKNRSHAKPLVRAWSNKLENVFFQMRYGMLSDDKIRELAKAFYDDQLEFDLKDRTSKPPMNTNEHTWWKERGHICEDFASEILGTLAKHPEHYQSSVKRKVENLTDKVLAEENIELDKKSFEYQKVYQAIGRAQAEAYRVIAKRDLDGTGDDFDHLFQANPSPVAPSPASVVSPVENKPKAIKLSDAIDRHVAAKQTERTAKESSIREYRRAYSLFLMYKGDLPIDEYTRDDLRGFLAVLQKIPTQQHLEKFKRMSLQEIAELDHGLPKYADKTIDDKYLMPIKSLFKWCSAEGYIQKNIGENLSFNYDAVRPDQQRDPFTKDELQGMIKGLTEVKDSDRPERYWIPLIALFTGARSNEICQLFTEDVKQEGNIWYFSIKSDPEKGQDVKSKNSIRDIPVHPTLIDLGFIDYVEQCRASQQPRLWMKLTLGKDGKYSRNFANWFNGQTRVEGFRKKYMTTDATKVFHSFRHNFATELKHKGVDLNVIEELEGRANTLGQSARYGKRYTLEIYLDALKKADFGLDFSPLL